MNESKKRVEWLSKEWYESFYDHYYPVLNIARPGDSVIRENNAVYSLGNIDWNKVNSK